MYLLFADLQQIRDDIQSRLWFTYRKGFVQIGNTNFTLLLTEVGDVCYGVDKW